jgi:hypothetical protein
VPHFRAFAVSGWNRCIRRSAKTRKYYDISGDSGNRNNAGISGKCVADDPVNGEPVSEARFPANREKEQGIS